MFSIDFFNQLIVNKQDKIFALLKREMRDFFGFFLRQR